MRATKRGVRRSTQSGRQAGRAVSLRVVVGALEERKARYGLTGYPRGHRVLIAMVRSGAGVTLTFAHPTKRSTEARYAFLQTSVAALQEAMGPAKVPA